MLFSKDFVSLFLKIASADKGVAKHSYMLVTE